MPNENPAAPEGGQITTQEQQAGTQPPAGPTQNQGETAPSPDALAALQAENARLQREAENARVQAKGKVAKDAQTKQLLALAEAIGIELPKGDDNSPEALQAKLQEEIAARQSDQQALVQERRDAAVTIAALSSGIAPEKQQYLNFLLGSNEAFTKLDTNDPNYKTSVTELVKTIAAADPFFAAAPGGTARSGAEVVGGAGAPGEVSQEAFNQMSVMEKSALYTKNPELYARLVAGSTP